MARQKFSKKPLVLPIKDITSTKTADGYQLHWGRRNFILHDNGKILQPELLFAVLRGLAVQPGPRN